MADKQISSIEYGLAWVGWGLILITFIFGSPLFFVEIQKSGYMPVLIFILCGYLFLLNFSIWCKILTGWEDFKKEILKDLQTIVDAVIFFGVVFILLNVLWEQPIGLKYRITMCAVGAFESVTFYLYGGVKKAQLKKTKRTRR